MKFPRLFAAVSILLVAFCKNPIESDFKTGMDNNTYPIISVERLWQNDAPGALGTDSSDIPIITVYQPDPDTANGTGIIICPGGGYGGLSVDWEGHEVANRLVDSGYTCFVLQYRFSPYRHPTPMLDGKRAVRFVRSKAAQWGVNPGKIGMLGFSAGGHMVSTVGTHFDSGNPEASDSIEHQSSRPDHLCLIYPVITMLDPYTHKGSRELLLGENVSQANLELLSNERHVTAQTPPTFLAHGDADKDVSLENSQMFFDSLKANGVESEFVVDTGFGHGYGMQGTWFEAYLQWLNK